MKSRVLEIQEEIERTVVRVVELEEENDVLRRSLAKYFSEKEQQLSDQYRAELDQYKEKTLQLREEMNELSSLFEEKTAICKKKEMDFYKEFGGQL